MFQNDDDLSAVMHMHCKLKPALCIIFLSPSTVLPSPVPEIRWKKLDGELPPNHEVRMAGAHLHLYNVQFEDAGTYTCEALNSKGKDYHTARVSVEGKKYVICHFSLLILKRITGNTIFLVLVYISCINYLLYTLCGINSPSLSCYQCQVSFLSFFFY